MARSAGKTKFGIRPRAAVKWAGGIAESPADAERGRGRGFIGDTRANRRWGYPSPRRKADSMRIALWLASSASAVAVAMLDGMFRLPPWLFLFFAWGPRYAHRSPPPMRR